MFIIMASPISTPTTSCSYSIPTCSKPSLFASLSSISYTTSPKNGVFTLNSLLGFASFSQWSGLKHLVISVTPKLIIKRRTMRFNGKTVRASLFGVGVPEALVIGVVALLVFGPKGLAEVARNLGKTLREFQPTIRELQDVSREFKSTLEREIGLDEISSQSRNMYVPKDTTGSTSSSVGSSENESTVDDPNGAASPKRAYTTEEYLKLTEEQLKVTAAQGEGQTPSTSEEPQLETQSGAEVDVKQSADTMPQPQKPENEVS